MPDIPLFRRKCIITVGTVQITDLAMTFKVHKSLKPEPNTAEVTIHNLNPDHRNALAQMTDAPVQIEAGYETGTSILFLGDLRVALSVHDKTDYVTKLSSGDGEKAVKKKRVTKTFKKGAATPQNVLRAVAMSLGVGAGNLNQAIAQLAPIGNCFSEGFSLSGSASREMTNVCRSLGLTWSIQSGKLQILPLKGSLQGQAISLSEKTGMLGSPTVDNKGIMSATMLITPDVFPGRIVVLDSEFLKGQYVIQSCDYAGDTHGGEWEIKIEGKRY